MSDEIIQSIEQGIDLISRGNSIPVYEEFYGENLKSYRSSHGLSQDALARKINVSTDTIRSWETGRRKPNKTMKDKIRELV